MAKDVSVKMYIVELGIIVVAVVLVTYLCQTLCDPMDCSPPASSVHGILQARILEWVAISFYSIIVQTGNI